MANCFRWIPAVFIIFELLQQSWPSRLRVGLCSAGDVRIHSSALRLRRLWLLASFPAHPGEASGQKFAFESVDDLALSAKFGAESGAADSSQPESEFRRLCDRSFAATLKAPAQRRWMFGCELASRFCAPPLWTGLLSAAAAACWGRLTGGALHGRRGGVLRAPSAGLLRRWIGGGNCAVGRLQLRGAG